LLLESKDKIKIRLGSDVALDDADALACTFAYDVQKTDHTAIIAGRTKSGFQADYSPFESAWSAGSSQDTQRKQNWLPGQQWGRQ
jgi:hypothetical protein